MAGALLKLLLGCLMFALVLTATLLPACCAGRFRRRNRRHHLATSTSTPSLSSSQQPLTQPQRPAWTGCLSVLAAGTLLSVGLLDMFPDAARQMSKAGAPVPSAHCLALGGLALVLAIEQLALVRCSPAAIMALALSVHSLFEGLAMGVEPNSAKLAAYFAAVVMHKLVVAVSLGLELAWAATGIRLRGLVACAVAFALASPAGLAVGLLLVSELENGRDSGGASAQLAGGLLQSCTSGTFLYVAFFEILPREFGYANRCPNVDADADAEAAEVGEVGRPAKLACLVAGFVIVSAYELLEHALLANDEGATPAPPLMGGM